ncbi:MAG: hypothetical protein ACREJ0_27060, partial [Geminicoccaceae bacterium]
MVEKPSVGDAAALAKLIVRQAAAIRVVLPSGDQGQACSMRIATFNINNVVRRLPDLLAWLRAAAP